MIRDHNAEMARDARNNLITSTLNAQRRLAEFTGTCAACGVAFTQLEVKAAVMHRGEVAVICRRHIEEWSFREADPEDVVKALGHEVEPGVWR